MTAQCDIATILASTERRAPDPAQVQCNLPRNRRVGRDGKKFRGGKVFQAEGTADGKAWRF